MSAHSILLFASPPEMELDSFGEAVNARLAEIGIEIDEREPIGNDAATFDGDGVLVRIELEPSALGADQFAGALDSPLSQAFSGLLSDALSRHCAYLKLTVERDQRASDSDRPDWLTLLQTTHAATVVLAELHMPSAVLWGQSNQLLTGVQYLSIAQQVTPWALFARARVLSLDPGDSEAAPKFGLRLEEAAQFIGRPIEFTPGPLPREEVHAAALSFLRHSVANGAPIPDGHSFGPKGGRRYLVSHVAPNEQAPEGVYQLSVASGDDMAPGGTARPSGADRSDAADPQGEDRGLTPSGVVASPAQALPQLAPQADERTRSLAIGIILLAIMPPIGAVLMLSNALFGSNSWRTGVLATAGIGAAMILGAYTFLNTADETAAVLEHPEVVRSTIIAD